MIGPVAALGHLPTQTNSVSIMTREVCEVTNLGLEVGIICIPLKGFLGFDNQKILRWNSTLMHDYIRLHQTPPGSTLLQIVTTTVVFTVNVQRREFILKVNSEPKCQRL